MQIIIKSMKIITVLISIISLMFLNGCEALKYKKVSAKEFPADPKERIKKNMEEGRGFRVMGGNKKGTTYSFATSNPLWRATLDTLDFMPLVSANYSGGIVVTDWYSENDNPQESIKISIRFLTNEIRSDAIDLKIFYRICKTQNNCSINERTSNLVNELKKEILKQAAIYKETSKNKNFKPYSVKKKKD